MVMDTNVLVSALRSKRGAAHRLLLLADSGKFRMNLSVPLFLEYEDAAKRLLGEISLTVQEIDDILDYLCKISEHRVIHYLWRPYLKDPKDDMVLELAVAAGCEWIVSFNAKDFQGLEKFGLKVIAPAAFLCRIGKEP